MHRGKQPSLRTRFAALAMLLTASTALGGAAFAAEAMTPEERQRMEAELREIREMRRDLQSQMGKLDDRLDALETKLTGQPPAKAKPTKAAAKKPETFEPAAEPSVAAAETAPAPAPAAPPAGSASRTYQTVVATPGEAKPEIGRNDDQEFGDYVYGKGFVLATGDWGELTSGMFSYARYLNQNGIDESYVDAFGRTKQIDKRQDFQFQKVSMNLKGWLFDPAFQYYFFFWTSQSAQGDGAQTVIGGWMRYKFDDWLTITAGIVPLPTTQSTNWSFPQWLKNDNRVMADEFFRGAYTQGIEASGQIMPGLMYRATIANNLSALGVSAAELDNCFCTYSGALWWMPTTGEFGPAYGFGDYEHHEELATMFGIHFTHSLEDAQGQPDEDVFDNSQIRLSDGTRLFSPNPFNNGTNIKELTYEMLAVNAGLKYKGFSLHGEYYMRWLDDFTADGPLPVTELFDEGYSIQASYMVMPKELQLYATGSQIFGEYGDPYEVGLGLNWFPFERKEARMNIQGIYESQSPSGGTSYPYQVGARGWILSVDWILTY